MIFLKREELTDRQKDTLTFICLYILKTGYSPSLREIAQGLYISKPVAVRYIKALESKGYIKHTPNIPRSIVVLKVS